jgi:hypothetical protein
MIVSFENLPGWVVPFAVMGIFYVSGRIHGKLLESKRSGGGDTSF